MSRDRTVGDTFYVAFTTRAFATGIPTTLGGTPVISAYEDGGTTQITAGVSIGADHDSVTGLNMITVVATGGNGFESGKDYNLVITTGTVSGVSVVGEVVGQFSLGLSAAAASLSAGVDVVSISGDSAAADNLEAMYDGTGYTDEAAPASRAQVGGLATGTSAISVQSESYVLTTGTQSSGTISDTETYNAVYHEHTDDAGTTELYYQFDVTGNGTAVSVLIDGRVNGSNDTIAVYAYDWGGASWDQIGTMVGTNGSTDVELDPALLVRHTGTGANLGKVRVRFYATGLTSSTLRIDRIAANYAVVTQSVGYSQGAVWIDTNNGTAGTTAFVHGVADNAVDTIADAVTIAAAVGVPDFHVFNGSSITLAANSENESFFGDHWTLALGGQACGGIYVEGATVSGVGTSSGEEMHFEGCDFTTATVEQGHFDKCGFSGTVTFNTADDYDFHGCYSKGAAVPVFTKTPGVAINAEFHSWEGDITISGLESGDNVELGGFYRTVTLNGADATVHIHGMYEALVDNLTGSPTVQVTGAIKTGDVASILVDTGTTLDTKLNDIQGATFSTSTDSLEAIRDRGDSAWVTGGGGSLTLADIADAVWDESLAAHQTALSAGRAATLGGVPIAETTATGTPTTTTVELTAGSSVDNYYRDATLRILSGSGVGQARIITSYTGSTKTCTFDEPLATAPSASDAVAVDMSHAHAVSSIADAVLDEALSGHTTAGTLGKAITDTETDAAAILVDTAQIGTAGAGLTDLGGMSTAMKAEVNAEADTAISDYDPPTNAEMVARTLVAGNYFNPAADTVATVTDVTNQVSANVTAISGDSTAADSLEASLETLVTGTATGTPTTTTMADSALTEATDDHYNGRVIIWRTGALKHQATDITSYDGTTKTFTFTATTNAASAGDAYVIV